MQRHSKGSSVHSTITEAEKNWTGPIRHVSDGYEPIEKALLSLVYTFFLG